nr:MAG: hypothetical protein [Bacteriophage sp.]
MKTVKNPSKKILIATRDEAFDLYVSNHPVISRLIREIGMVIVQQAYFGNHIARISIETDDRIILNSIYQVLENSGYSHSFDKETKVLTVYIL